MLLKWNLGLKMKKASWKYNGVNAVGLAIIPQPGANYINISNEFNKRIEDIKKNRKI